MSLRGIAVGLGGLDDLFWIVDRDGALLVEGLVRVFAFRWED